MAYISQLNSIVPKILISVIVITGALYFWEYNKPVSDYVNVHGVITTKDSYTVPDTIEAAVFGKSVEGQHDFNMSATLFCNPLKYPDRAVHNVGAVHTDIDVLDLAVPDVGKVIIHPVTGQYELGVFVERSIRLTMNDTTELVSLGQLYPKKINSSCRVHIDVTAKTPIFKIAKTSSNTSGYFTYIVPGGIEPAPE